MHVVVEASLVHLALDPLDVLSLIVRFPAQSFHGGDELSSVQLPRPNRCLPKNPLRNHANIMRILLDQSAPLLKRF
jgi:hypothetical protein